MANLTYLNEASVLHNLRERYINEMIYVSFVYTLLMVSFVFYLPTFAPTLSICSDLIPHLITHDMHPKNKLFRPFHTLLPNV